ncbi:MAG: CBS domain-containing protein [Bacteriovoracaceae bacterium]|nr:CBS domain-containing protein [Bacteriovoracaceae bacterium]
MEVIDKSRFDITVGELPLNPVKMISHESKIGDVITMMQKEGFGSALVEENQTPCGIVTERDLIMKYSGNYNEFLELPITDIMTKKLITISSSEAVATCMNLIGRKRIRHIPVSDESGKVVKMISVNDLLKFIIDTFPIAVKSIGPLREWSVNQIHVQDENFSFAADKGTSGISGSIFMTPLKKVVTKDLVKIDVSSSINQVIEAMQKFRNGMVILTQHETMLKGIITERDILRKVLGKHEVGTNIPAKQFMTPNPDTLLEKHILSYGINNMFTGRYRNIILVDEERIPVSYVSLVDIIQLISEKIKNA